MRKLLQFLTLPSEISSFEASYLRRVNRVGLAFFALHVPVFALLAWLNKTGVLSALALSLGVLVGPVIAQATLRNPRHVSVVYGVTAMFMGGLLVHFGQGPVQIEMHFYFFALIAMLAVYGNPRVILAAAVTVALHHLVLWFVLPRSVFNYDAPVWVVAVHAAFVVLESVAGCFIARSFFDNVIGLEKIVLARTAELDKRNGDMRLVLDTVAEGFLTIDRQGIPSTERSRAFDTIFGAPADDETLFDVLARRAPAFGRTSAACWEEVIQGFLPLEVTLEQMPHDFSDGPSHFRVLYKPVGDAESPERFLVVVVDVTAEVQRARVEEEQREALRLFERILADRNGFAEFFEDASNLVEAVTVARTTDMVTYKRMLHTLKGNSAVYRLDSVARICHELESYMAEFAGFPPATHLSVLAERWSRLSRDVEKLLGARSRVIEIDQAQHEALMRAVQQAVPPPRLLAMLYELKLEPTRRRLENFADQARRIAERLEKGPIEVSIEDHDVRVDAAHWSPFWGALVHLVRNAIDHGLEPSDERTAKGKEATGRLALRTYVEEQHFIVEVADDGRGVDWESLTRKAKELGLPHSTPEELGAAIFVDGVSTAHEVTDVSGRGVGMGAVRAATEALGGRIAVETKAGGGTILRMRFPAEKVAAGRPSGTRPSMGPVAA